MIREMAVKYELAFKDVYNTLYNEFSRQSGTDIHILYRASEGMSKMDTLQAMEPEHGFLTQFFNIIKHEYQELKN